MPRVSLVQYRNGIATAWTAANPVLADGEPGYEKDTKRSKVGDGVTPWATLPYTDVTYLLAAQKGIANGVATLGATTKIPTAQLSTGVANGLATLDAATKLPAAQLPVTAMLTTSRGVANGVASLDATTKIPAAQLPSPVGSVNGKMPYRNLWLSETVLVPDDQAGTMNKWAVTPAAYGDQGAGCGITLDAGRAKVYVSVAGLYEAHVSLMDYTPGSAAYSRAAHIYACDLATGIYAGAGTTVAGATTQQSMDVRHRFQMKAGDYLTTDVRCQQWNYSIVAYSYDTNNFEISYLGP
jgi:hypothetical protein